MGSCFSKKEKEKLSAAAAAAAADSREPPAPESPQEEKVKEVLSETPKPRPSARRTTTSPQQEQKKKKEPEKTKKGGDEPICYDQRSEDTLEVYSIISESFSASTPLADQKKKKNDDEEEEVEEHKRRAERSPARRCHHQRKRSFSGELQQQPAAVKVGCRSGRSSPSPPVGRTHSAREPAAARTRPLAHSSHQCEKFRRDHSGDRSVRRSLSPARKLAAVPDHRRSNGGGQCRGLSGRCSPQRAAAAAATEGGSGIGGGGGLEEESLENPLVSLECFIFL